MALGSGDAGLSGQTVQPSADPVSRPNRFREALCLGLGLVWIIFQIYIIFHPQAPLVERPFHLALAATLLFLWTPLASARLNRFSRLLDALIICATLSAGAYYLLSAQRLTERMEGVDPVFPVDIFFGILVVLLLLEGVRRVVGWSLLGVLLAFLVYAFVGNWIPGWLRFSGFGLQEAVEILSMSLNGIMGITTATSVEFVFYFILFGAVYAAIGGGQLFIDIGLKLAGAHSGGTAKAAIVSSSLMGSISGSAVANVAGTGVFTIPLMRRAGYSAEMAGAIEAIASTGGQLMPPVMGVAAFVMAEMLQVDYGRIALAGLAPAVAFYIALFISVDLRARKTGIGTLPEKDTEVQRLIMPRLYLLTPPVILVGMLIAGYSATYAAVIASSSCLIVCYFRRESALDRRALAALVEDSTRQACQVAIPIAAIGMIIAVAIQSNLALKFSSQLMAGSGGTLLGGMALIVVGCIVMGMGLPTVAAYIIGTILFVPALLKLGIPEMSAHFFVMYYCVLSMVTPPVALASYAAAGIAGGGVMKTSVYAFRLSFVSFLIPFAIAFDPRLLGQGEPIWVAAACLSLAAGTAGWAVAVVGYWTRSLRLFERVWFGVSAATVICSPTGTAFWFWSVGALMLGGVFVYLVKTRTLPGHREVLPKGASQ